MEYNRISGECKLKTSMEYIRYDGENLEDVINFIGKRFVTVKKDLFDKEIYLDVSIEHIGFQITQDMYVIRLGTWFVSLSNDEFEKEYDVIGINQNRLPI